MSAALELVCRLEALDLEPYFLDPAATQQILNERAGVLAELLQVAPSELDEFRARLLAVQDRDERWKLALAKLHEQTRDAVSQVEEGRRAMSGYKKTVSEGPPPPRRAL